MNTPKDVLLADARHETKRANRIAGAKTLPIYFAAVVGLALCLATGGIRAADFFIVPGNLAAVEGDANNAAPFSSSLPGTMRYQQVYAASAFSGLTGPGLITQIAFRPDATYGTAFSAVITNIQINLSTTSVAPGGMSSLFADNVGPNEQVVLNGALSLSSAFSGPGGGPKDFDAVINLQNPFLYDPAAGNLLMDLWRFSSVELLSGGSYVRVGTNLVLGFTLDAASTSSETSRTWTSYARSQDVNSPSGTVSSLGLVTGFTITPVPEPGALGLVAVAALSLAQVRRRRKGIGSRALPRAPSDSCL